jgi:hypothetical protein
MTTSQFSTEHMIKIWEQAERAEQSISVICREPGSSAASF